MADTQVVKRGKFWYPICTECGAEGAYVNGKHPIISGGYGSARHDVTSLVWLVDREKETEVLCDDCVDRHIEAGHLEPFSASLCELPKGTPSEAAYRALFAWGARRMVETFEQENCGPLREVAFDGDAMDRIRRLRNQSTGKDDGQVVRMDDKPDRMELAQRAIHVGEVHALSAIALGYMDGDPGFEMAAAAWAEERTATDRHIARLHDRKAWASAEQVAEAELSILFDDPDPQD